MIILYVKLPFLRSMFLCSDNLDALMILVGIFLYNLHIS